MNKINTKIINGMTIAILATQATSLLAETPLTQKQPSISSNAKQSSSWLGITLGAIPASLNAQLSAIIPKGQGVLVNSVSKDSPAKKAGIEINDILLSVDDQKLYSATQLSGLIRNTKPKTKILFKVVHQGQLKDISVILGERKKNLWSQHPSQGRGFGNSPSWLSTIPNLNQGSTAPSPKVFGSFESVQVRTLADGRYHAEVSYKNKANETKQFTFEGKREEIIEQVKKHKELPDDKKRSLINALNMNLGSMNPLAGFNNSLFNHPFFNQSLGQINLTPFLQGNPFNDPFFQNGFGNNNLFQTLPQLKIFTDPRSFTPQNTQPFLPIQPIQKGSLI